MFFNDACNPAHSGNVTAFLLPIHKRIDYENCSPAKTAKHIMAYSSITQDFRTACLRPNALRYFGGDDVRTQGRAEEVLVACNKHAVAA
jgi:hypothetical protein